MLLGSCTIKYFRINYRDMTPFYHRRLPKAFWRIGLFMIMLFFSACSSTENVAKLDEIESESFSQGGVVSLDQKWWRSFDDAQLDTLVAAGLSENFTIRSAWQRLKASQAVVDRASAGLFPSVDASASENIIEGTSEPNVVQSFELGLAANYEVDLWGRINAESDAAAFRAQASYFDYQTVALTLSAEIARSWFALSEARAQKKLVEEQIATNTRVLDLLKNRLGIDQVRSVDVLRQQQLVESTKEQLAYIEAQISVLEHQLALLTGNSPVDFSTGEYSTLPDLPELPETGVTTDLIQRRPDIQAQLNVLKAADKDLAAAISNQYPRLSFSVSGSTAESDARNLFEDWTLSFTGNLLAPIFYGGELRAEVDRTKSVKKQRLFEYGQTVLVAFQEVENALAREFYQREAISRIEKQLDLARKAYDQLRVSYFNGAANYLEVLTALDEVQQLQRNVLSARQELIAVRIGLYRALSGSVQPESDTQ